MNNEEDASRLLFETRYKHAVDAAKVFLRDCVRQAEEKANKYPEGISAIEERPGPDLEKVRALLENECPWFSEADVRPKEEDPIGMGDIMEDGEDSDPNEVIFRLRYAKTQSFLIFKLKANGEVDQTPTFYGDMVMSNQALKTHAYAWDR